MTRQELPIRAVRAEREALGQEPPARPLDHLTPAAAQSADACKAAEAGAQTADQVFRGQMDAGRTADQIDARQERIVSELLTDSSSPAEQRFATVYAEVVDTYTADMRDLDLEAG